MIPTERSLILNMDLFEVLEENAFHADQETIERTREDAREGKSPSTQAAAKRSQTSRSQWATKAKRARATG